MGNGFICNMVNNMLVTKYLPVTMQTVYNKVYTNITTRYNIILKHEDL